MYLIIDNSVCLAGGTELHGHIDASLNSRCFGGLPVSSHCSSARSAAAIASAVPTLELVLDCLRVYFMLQNIFVYL
jgi:hypothetical protein